MNIWKSWSKVVQSHWEVVFYSQFKCTQQSVDNLLQCKLTFLEMAYKLSDSFFFPIAKTLIITLHHLFAQKKSNDYFLVD